ncbi:MAG: DUF11 domain-containing protein [Erythrobacter sp.]|nr:DUF11 domain-containing protein [Erythrobacter sp.]
MTNARLTTGIALATLIATGSALPAKAEGVDAGTIISNTAQATYDAAGGSETISSNSVELAVDELLDVTLTSLDGAPIGANPGGATLTYELTNTGNGPEAFRLTAIPAVAGNDFDTTFVSIAVDTNGNGVYDAGVDAILTGPETTAELAPDEALTLFVNVTVPGTVSDGQQSDVQLQAEATTGTGAPGAVFANQGVNGVDAIVGSTGATATALGSLIAGVTTVSLVKSQSVADPFGGTGAVPGSVITYTIVASVSGSGSVNNLVVTDAFPTGTTYSASSITLDGTPLTDASGDDAGTANAGGISVDLGTVAAGSNHSITFGVTVD